MPMRTWLLVLCLFGPIPFGSTMAAQQTGVLSGRVTDVENGNPLAGAQIVVQGGSQPYGGISTSDGSFRIPLPPGRYSVVVEFLGYRAERIPTVLIRAGETTTADVQLTSTALLLDGLVVSASRGVAEKQVDAPASTHIVGSVEIQERAVTTPVEHLRDAPGVDIITHGVQATNVVIRGFNNIFSGSLHALTDYRLAGVPSLRVNLLHLVPANNEDIDRMEVVLGPGAALYGPNTANGVLHILTRSPLESQGTTLSLAGGERSVLQGGFRTAFLVNRRLGVKLSGQYIQGREWEYLDLGEDAARRAALANPQACVSSLVNLRNFDQATAQLACQRVGLRDFDFSRYGLEARADYRFARDGLAVLTYGRTSASSIELTGLGAAQAGDWTYQFLQGRLRKGRFFAQAYVNSSDAGNTFLLRDGVPLVDQSKLVVAQAQHGFGLWGGRQDFTYGVDFFGTRPETKGTINGSYEDKDNVDEWGVYLQSKTGLTPKLDVVLAGRLDSHSALPEDVFSPRAALIFKPLEGQSFRASYNRAFSTPSTLNLFLDISAGAAPNTQLAALGYTLRAFGTGKTGYSFQNPDKSLKGMRSPFNPQGADKLLPVNVSVAWPLAVGAAAAVAARQGTPLPPSIVQLLNSLQPTPAQVGLNVYDPVTLKTTPVAQAEVRPVPPIRESYTETFELGWQGVLGNQLRVMADVYRAKITDFTSPLTLTTPLILLNGQQVAAFIQTPIVTALTQQYIAAGLPPSQAQTRALADAQTLVPQLATALGSVPVGVVSSPEVAAKGADLVVTYLNMGGLEYWGGDLAFTWFATDKWTVTGTYSFVSEDYFRVDGVIPGTKEPVALNAPKHKGTLGLGYRDVARGFNAEARVRFHSEFPAMSAGYSGTKCLLRSGEQPGLFDQDCVAQATLVDLNAGYLIPRTRATVQLTVSNLFDKPYRSFVGVPDIGRFALLRVKYDLF